MSDSLTKLNRDQLIFTMSLLSNVSANDIESDSATLKTNAVNNLNAYLKTLSTALPADLSIVWGPFTANSALQSDSSLYNTDNMMFVAKAADPKYDGNMYIVAVAGTNPSSNFAWFNEDFMVNKVVPYGTNGYVSLGATTGVTKHQGMYGTTSNGTVPILSAFLKSQTTSNDRIIVTGHSLGGALAPLMAITLKDALQKANANRTFECHTYAGPSTGDSTFMNYMIGRMDTFQAINNTLDIVPLAWQSDNLKEIPGLYEKSDCKKSDPMKNNCITNCDGKYGIGFDFIVNGVIKWALNQSTVTSSQGKVIQYAAPDPTHTSTFIGGDDLQNHFIMYKGVPVSICTALPAMALDIINTDGDIYKDLNTIWQDEIPDNQKTSDKLGVDDLTRFLSFLAIAGKQHIGCYIDEILPSDVIDHVKDVIGPSNNPDAAKQEGDYNLLQLLNKVVSYLNPPAQIQPPNIG